MPKALYSFLLIALLLSCEKDDVCPEGTPGTPSLVIRLYDKDNPETLKAPAEDIDVFGLGREELMVSITSDSTALELDPFQQYTRLAFVLSETASSSFIDTLQINYSREDVYFNRACGYRREFILGASALESLGENAPFYSSYTVLIDTLSNENQAHLALYH